MKFESTDGFVFESNSSNKVKIIERWWNDNKISVDKIKNNLISNRHAWLVNLTLWGSCNITNDYWKTREMLQYYHDSLVDELPKTSSKRVIMRGSQGREIAAEKVFRLTGWRF